jgi:hypothetical protein
MTMTLHPDYGARARLDAETRAPMSAYAKTALAASFGIALGLAATYVVTAREFPFGAARSGSWTAWPRSGAMDVDPYARAIVARKADVPLGNGEGIVFVAHADADDRPLDGRCDYSLEGAMPAARLWTLAAYTPKGRIADVNDGHRELTSANVLRSSDGEARIVAAPFARAGNWLAVPHARPFALALTLYDAAASPTQTSLEGLPLPTIRRGACS